jgi:hypothetical protein
VGPSRQGIKKRKRKGKTGQARAAGRLGRIQPGSVRRLKLFFLLFPFFFFFPILVLGL